MEPKDIDDSSARRNSYKSIPKRKAISRVDEVQSIIDDNAIAADSSVMLVGSSQQRSVKEQPKKKRSWNSTLSEEQKKEVCKRKREAYALKKALAKKAIRNEHMVMIPTMGTSKVTDVHTL